MPRSCCDPCADPGAVILRGGTAVVHLTNQMAGAAWDVEFPFFSVDGNGAPDPTQPVNFTGSTWAFLLYLASAPTVALSTGVTISVDSSTQATGVIFVGIDVADPVVGPGCAPSYLFALRQTRDGRTLYPVVGSIQVGTVANLAGVSP